MQQKRTSTWLWPVIEDIDSARRAARQGVWAAGLSAVVTSLFAALALGGVGPEAFVEAGVFAIIALGIRKMSRIAAVAGFALYLFEQVLVLREGGLGSGPRFSAIFFIVMFSNAIRGTYAYHKLANAAAVDSRK